MADIAALQLPTMSPPCFPASFPISPDSPQRAQLLWRRSASSVSVQRETFQNRRALSALDSLTRAIDDCHGVWNSGSYQGLEGVSQSATSVENTGAR